jgi:hypothetical protein
MRSATGGDADPALLIDLRGSARIRCIGREQGVCAVCHEQKLIAADGGGGLHRPANAASSAMVVVSIVKSLQLDKPFCLPRGTCGRCGRIH